MESRARGVRAWWVCTTSPSDWDDVAALAASSPDEIVPFYGVHPWHGADLPANWLADLERRLVAEPRAGVGECGLDTTAHAALPLDVQTPILCAQIDLAARYERPVSLHAAGKGALSALLEVLKDSPKAEFHLHGFTGSIELAKAFHEMGVMLGVGPRLSAERRAALFAALPATAFEYETDAE